MRILVTGASGFVGRALTRSLAAVGYRVRAAARDSASIRPAELVEPVALPDLSRRIDWRPLLDDVDAVVHCAGIAHASAKVAEEQYERVNLRATKDLALTASLMDSLRSVAEADAQASAIALTRGHRQWVTLRKAPPAYPPLLISRVEKIDEARGRVL